MDRPCMSRADRLLGTDVCLAAAGDGVDPHCACFARQSRRRGGGAPALLEPERAEDLTVGG
eukprot:14975580-Alexandrium_andersonii.AAC.1